MASLSSRCGNCCCSECGEIVPSGVSDCCMCVCSELCITITGVPVGEAPGCPTDTGTGTDSCSCEIDKHAIQWDSTECAYIGTVTCGDLSIDLRFDIKKCNYTGTGTAVEAGTDEDCLLCLTSTCLGINGDCPTDCQVFGRGKGGCGKYMKELDQLGGFSGSWTVDATGCGDTNCDSIVIEAECLPRVNPHAEGTRICRNCDCVCKKICLSYGTNSCPSQTKKVEFDTANNRWQHTFTHCAVDQTVTVQIVLGYDGCCAWELTVSEGTVDEPTEVLTACPDATADWTVSDISTGVGTATESGEVSMVCAKCNDCLPFSCCCNGSIPLTLTATLYDENECPCIDGLEITLHFAGGSPQQQGADMVWYGSGVMCGECEIHITLLCGFPNCDIFQLGICTVGTGASMCPDGDCGPDQGPTEASQDCNGFSNPCCEPFLQEFGSHTDDCCCVPDTPATSFCVVVTE